MSKQQTSLTQDIEQLLKKASEANTIIISETTKFLQQLTSTKLDRSNLAAVQKQLFKDAVNLFVKVNLQHTSNLIDMGVAISRHLNDSLHPTNGAFKQDVPQTEADTDNPAFELKTSGQPGATAYTAFLLNSDKQETVKCELFNSEFTGENDPTMKAEVEAVFNPRIFDLHAANFQKVDMRMQIGKNVKPGLYRTHIKVQGFEHTHFDVLLEVLPPTVEEHTKAPTAKPAPAKKKLSKKNPRKSAKK